MLGCRIIAARDDQPLVAGAVEVQIGHVELELGLASRHGGTLLVLRDEAEIGLALKIQVGHVSSRSGPDPAASGHEASARIVYWH